MSAAGTAFSGKPTMSSRQRAQVITALMVKQQTDDNDLKLGTCHMTIFDFESVSPFIILPYETNSAAFIFFIWQHETGSTASMIIIWTYEADAADFIFFTLPHENHSVASLPVWFRKSPPFSDFQDFQLFS